MNIDRYFPAGQKVLLVNISDSRDELVYESLSASVVSSDDSRITLKAPYRIFSGENSCIQPGMHFKLATESFGVGVQLCVELLNSPGLETLTVAPAGIMEIYKRRSALRTEARLPFLHVLQKSSLSAFQKEWRRVIGDLHRTNNPPRLKLQEQPLNISAGGVRFEISSIPTPLAMVVIDLQDNLPPVCAVTELVWHKNRQDSEMFISGHRFVDILKEDQIRLADFSEKRESGTETGKMKDNWDLKDRMINMPDKKKRPEQ